MLFNFSMPVLIIHMWQLKIVVSPHWCLICTLLLYKKLFSLGPRVHIHKTVFMNVLKIVRHKILKTFFLNFLRKNSI